jgi:hypothetical protein
MNETRTVRPKWPNNLWLLISDPMAPIVFPQYKMGSNPSSSPHTRLPPAPSPPSPVARSLSRSLSPIACRRDGRRAPCARCWGRDPPHAQRRGRGPPHARLLGWNRVNLSSFLPLFYSPTNHHHNWSTAATS